MQSDISALMARRELWRRGNLRFLLDVNQRQIADFLRMTLCKIPVVASSRQIGKSFMLTVLAVEHCIKYQNSIVLYVMPKQNQTRKNMRPIMQQILTHCPDEMRPEFKTMDNVYRFSNGSEIHVRGSDAGRHESMRGLRANLVIIDEAGFIDELDYVVQSVLLPTTTTTGGKIILSSTPPKSADHPFIDTFYKKAELEGGLIKRTIYDNPRLTPDQVFELKRGCTDVSWRREFLVEIITDDEYAVVPEFTAELEAKVVKSILTTPPYIDRYVSMDIGFKDLTVVLFAYFDFLHSRVVIEDELVMSGSKMTLAALNQGIRAKEDLLWQGAPTYKRISDNNQPIVLNDLLVQHKLLFLPSAKDEKEAAINSMRHKLSSGHVHIHARCKTLIHHLKYATWNKGRTSYERPSDSSHHYDALDALVYLIRNVDWYRNPHPNGYDDANWSSSFEFRKSKQPTEHTWASSMFIPKASTIMTTYTKNRNNKSK